MNLLANERKSSIQVAHHQWSSLNFIFHKKSFSLVSPNGFLFFSPSITFLLYIWLHLTLLNPLRQTLWLPNDNDSPCDSLSRLWCQSKIHLMNSLSLVHLHLVWGYRLIELSWILQRRLFTKTNDKKLRFFSSSSSIYFKTLICCLRSKLDYLVVITTNVLNRVEAKMRKCGVTRTFKMFSSWIIGKLRCHNHSDINWILKHLCDCREKERRLLFQPFSKKNTTSSQWG